MNIKLIKAPTKSFLEMMFTNIRASDRKRVGDDQWGAVGLVQAKLIDLYWAADIAEKASTVQTALVMGNCPQHIQMLAIFGKQMAVRTALDKIQESRKKIEI